MEFLTHVLTRIFLDKLLWHHILWKIFDLSFDWILLRDADAFLPYDGYVKIKPDRLASKEDTETLFLIVKYHTEVLFLFDPRRSTIKLHTIQIKTRLTGRQQTTIIASVQISKFNWRLFKSHQKIFKLFSFIRKIHLF